MGASSIEYETIYTIPEIQPEAVLALLSRSVAQFVNARPSYKTGPKAYAQVAGASDPSSGRSTVALYVGLSGPMVARIDLVMENRSSSRVSISLLRSTANNPSDDWEVDNVARELSRAFQTQLDPRVVDLVGQGLDGLRPVVGDGGEIHGFISTPEGGE